MAKLGTLSYDLRGAARSLAKQPRFTLAVAVVLALGIGANTAVFTLAHRVLLRPLAYPEPERLVRLWPGQHVNQLLAQEVSEQAETLAAVSPYYTFEVPAGGEGDPVMVRAARVGAAHFSLLGVDAAVGRVFSSDEARPGAERVAILGHGFWSRNYGGDRDTVGRSLALDGVEHTVIGVLGRGPEPLPEGVDVWLPLAIDPADQQIYLGSFYHTLIGRLKPEVQASEAEAELAAVVERVRQVHPNLITDSIVASARVVSLHEDLVGRLRPTFSLLAAAVAVVLLISCGNIANLVLARAINRARDTAVKVAYGASRGRLVQHLMAETALLGLAGGVLGLVAGYYALAALRTRLPAAMPRLGEISIDAAAVAFNFAVALAAALVFGLVAVRRVVRVRLQSELNESGTGRSTGPRGRKTGRLLLTVQIAGTSALLIAGGLLLLSLWRLQRVDPGIDHQGLATFRLHLPQALYQDGPAMVGFFDEATQRIRRLPGVAAAGGVHLLPLTPDNWSFPYLAEGHGVPPGGQAYVELPVADFRVITPGYLETVRVAVLAGRTLDERDDAGSPPTGLISRTLADQLWGLERSEGRTIQLFGAGGPSFTVVGVVDDVRSHRLDDSPRPTIYRPLGQWPIGFLHLFVRSDLELAALAPSLRAEIWSVDRDVPVSDLRPFRDVVSASLADERLAAFVINAFGGLALLLALFGVYSVHSYTVAQRAHEFGIRLTLGAERRQILLGVLREALAIGLVGLLLGVLAAIAASGFLERHLYHVSPIDPLIYAVSLLLVAVVSVASSLLPAWRAMRVDPVISLRAAQ